jgi:uncharacterized membrane protein (UPF0182 family)
LVIIPFYPELPSLVLVALTVLFRLAVVALFHSAYNSATSLREQKFTEELIPESALAYAAGALVVLAVVFTRGHLAYETSGTKQGSGSFSTS